MLRLCILSLIAVQMCVVAQVEESPWSLIANIMPDDLRLVPAVGNGHVATQVYSDTLYINNVFNGFGDDSHRARVQSPVGINISMPGDSTSVYELDMYRGLFIRHVEDDDVIVEHRVYAHRSRTRLLVNEIELTRKVPGSGSDIILNLFVNSGEPSMDMDLVTVEHSEDTWLTSGETLEPELNDEDYRPVYMYWQKIPQILVLLEGSDHGVLQFVTSVSTDQEDALASYEDGTNRPDGELLQEHIDAWAAIWENGHIEISDNLTLAQTINACFFHIFISCMTEDDTINPFAGLSPGGLARGGKISPNNTGGPYNDYAGHVFWDMDTWIMPPIMIFQPGMARIMISARTRVMDAARDHAQTTGYEGVRFPWEQAYSGYETCPWEESALYQIHVTGDVAYSLRQFLYVTEDVEILNAGQGAELAMDIGRFWKSRVVLEDEDKGYEINGVMGPDEYHYNVNNSVFTNYNAELSLRTPAYLRDKLGFVFTPDEEAEIESFNAIADDLFILFDEERQFHPQFEGFDDENSTIKQSDVVLLGYPLMMPMTAEVRRNDLEIYEKITDPTGPDTGTWSMHTVGWLELGDPERAEDMFSMMFRNINGPFKIFSEKPSFAEDDMRATNFITGMGGMLQSVVFGYAGIRVRMYQMDLDPYLLPNSQLWELRGLKYRSSTLNLVISEDVEVELVEQEPGAEALFLVDSEDVVHELQIDTPVEIERASATIYALSDLPFKYHVNK